MDYTEVYTNQWTIKVLTVYKSVVNHPTTSSYLDGPDSGWKKFCTN